MEKLSRVIWLFVSIAGCCACVHAPLVPAPPAPPGVANEPETIELFDAVDNADQLLCPSDLDLNVVVWQPGRKRPAPSLALAISPGDHTTRTDPQGRAHLGLLPAGTYRLALADPRYGLLESRLLAPDPTGQATLFIQIEELGNGLGEVEVRGKRVEWCGSLGELCGLPLNGKERLPTLVDGFIRGLPH